MNNVVSVDESYVFAAGELDSKIANSADAEIFGVGNRSDFGILGGEEFDSCGSIVSGAIIYNDELVVSKSLCFDRLDSFSEGVVGIVYRNDDGDRRLFGSWHYS